MLSAIKAIGEYTKERDNVDELDIVLDKIDADNYNKVLAIELERIGNDFVYLDVIEEDFDNLKNRNIYIKPVHLVRQILLQPLKLVKLKLKL